MAEYQDGNNSQPLTDAQRAELIARMKTAWDSLPPEDQAKLKPMLNDASSQFGNYLDTGALPHPKLRPILRLKSFLTGDWDGHNAKLHAQATGKTVEISVAPGGEILGTGKFEELDPLWELVSGTVWLENLLHKHPFPPGTPTPVKIPDVVTIAMISDWGTGNFGAGDSPSTKIAKFIPSLEPHITIHLGDVYYAGTASEERHRLIDVWPRGSFGSFCLNSNHEMYSGGGPYFNDAVGGPVFNKYQSPWSFFALENSNWIIVGLDSAYNADVLTLYLDGSLGTNNAQLAFLKQMAAKATSEKKKVIVLTHHNGIPEAGDQSKGPLKLFTQVTGAFEGSNPPAYWYGGTFTPALPTSPSIRRKACAAGASGMALCPGDWLPS